MAWSQAHRSNKKGIPTIPADLQVFRRVSRQMLYNGRSFDSTLLDHAPPKVKETPGLHVREVEKVHSLLSHVLATTPTNLYQSIGEKGEVKLAEYREMALWKRLADPYKDHFDFNVSEVVEILYRLYTGRPHALTRSSQPGSSGILSEDWIYRRSSIRIGAVKRNILQKTWCRSHLLQSHAWTVCLHPQTILAFKYGCNFLLSGTFGI